MSKIDQQFQLLDHINCFASIQCYMCLKTEKLDIPLIDATDSLDFFWKKGWRVKNDNCICNKCLLK